MLDPSQGSSCSVGDRNPIIGFTIQLDYATRCAMSARRKLVATHSQRLRARSSSGGGMVKAGVPAIEQRAQAEGAEIA